MAYCPPISRLSASAPAARPAIRPNGSRARAGTASLGFSRQPLDESHWADYARSIFYVTGSFSDSRAYLELKAKLESVDHQFGIPASRVFYLSVPPQVTPLCVKHLKDLGMISDPKDTRSFTRIIVEKPIGRDLPSANEVLSAVSSSFAENQTYRIDHYMGKETVQNLLVLRFANSIFEPLWNQKYIDHVQITVSEEEGLTQSDPKTGEASGSRIGYYENVGAFATCCRTTCFKCCASWPWNRRGRWRPMWSVTPRWACSDACGR